MVNLMGGKRPGGGGMGVRGMGEGVSGQKTT